MTMRKFQRQLGLRCLTQLFTAILLVVISTTIVAASQVRAVATFSVIADLVAQVGGERVIVTSIVPLGGDPHSWEPTPREARHVAAADVLFYNGLGLELWVDRLIQNAARRDLPIIVLSEGLTPRPGATFAAHSHEEGDPHFWLNVVYAMHYVDTITEAFVEVDPTHAAYYRENAATYSRELAALDVWLKEQVASIPYEHRRIITYHDGFGYLADRYGLTVEGFLVVNPDREPSAREMVELTHRLAKFPKPVIFIEPQISASLRYAEAIAGETGATIAMLYSDSLTADVPTYFDMMRYNATSLVEALR